MPVGRHHRQQILPQFGEAGQVRLARSHVWIVGCGALGSASADQLARAGVGRLTLVDRDVVELTNLQRQTLFTESDIQRPKASAARDRLASIDSAIHLRAHDADCSPALVEHLLSDAVPDLILDGTDNFETRYLLNDVAVREHVPLVYAGVIGTEAMAAVIHPGHGPCLRCIEPSPPPPGLIETCDTAGVLAAAVQVAASMQVIETLKLLTDGFDGTWLIEQNVWNRTHRRVDLAGAIDAQCRCCAVRSFEFLEQSGGRGASGAVVLCGKGAVQITPAKAVAGSIDLALLTERLRAHGKVVASDGILRCALEAEPADDREQHLSLLLFADGRALVRGTSDLKRARTVYARYVGT